MKNTLVVQLLQGVILPFAHPCLPLVLIFLMLGKFPFDPQKKHDPQIFFYTYVATNLTICCLRKKCTCTFSLHCFDVPRSFWTRNKSQRLLVKVGLWTSPISCKAKKNAALRIRKLPQVSSYCEDRPIITAIQTRVHSSYRRVQMSHEK